MLCRLGRELGRAFEDTMLALDKRFIKNRMSENPNLKLNGEGNGEQQTHFAGYPGERSTFLGM
jgi:hypothetical protein